ncbi:MAG: AAA domain-containing protein [bacterium]
MSTYTALNKLIVQIPNTTSENKLIEDLLSSTLGGEPFTLQSPAISEEQIRQAIKFIPFTLSERQKNSIYQAWTNKISYIQGPPGTGKSHTIAAIMLSAFFLGKKVLLVSQKKAAIDVVQAKVRDLSGGQDALIFISEKPEVKALLRERLSNVLQDVGHDYRHEKLHRSFLNHEKIGSEIKRKREELAELRAQIKRLVGIQRDYYRWNSEFIAARDSFVKTFRTGQIPFAILSNDITSKWLRKLSETGKKRDREVPSLTRCDILSLKALRKKAVKDLGGNPELLDILTPSFELYLSQLVRCCQLYSETSRLTNATHEADDINKYRESYQSMLGEIMELQKKYVASKQSVLIRENLQRSEERENLDSFRTMLRNTNASLIEGRMTHLDYGHLTKIFPLWAGLIRDLGSYLRFDSELFDLVIVDESSQVNIAEVLPAFYRGKSICVVGDQKQLGLNAAGLFALNRQFEDMAWNSHFGRSYSLSSGDEKGLLVSKHSILEFITNPNNNIQAPSSTLNEHFRSVPKLAEFTSQKFYSDEGGLNLMTLVGDKVTRPCFKAIPVDGLREIDELYVPNEIDEALKLLSSIVRDEVWRTDPLLKDHFRNGVRPSLGILSFTTGSNIAINLKLRDDFTEEEIFEYRIFAGTTEEFQGNERNIMILLLGADSTISRSSAFYSDRRRVNVATSRAINFTYLIYGGIPSNFGLLNSYLRFFDIPIEEQNQPIKLVEKYYNWRFDDAKMESEFEGRVYPYLCEFVAKQFPGQPWKVFNQVPSCGKRIDFVLFNPISCRALAIEVDGPDHYDENSTSYTDTHLERESILLRAGWDILHIPYYKWYSNGWLAEKSNKIFCEYLVKLSSELKNRIERAPIVY